MNWSVSAVVHTLAVAIYVVIECLCCTYTNIIILHIARISAIRTTMEGSKLRKYIINQSDLILAYRGIFRLQRLDVDPCFGECIFAPRGCREGNGEAQKSREFPNGWNICAPHGFGGPSVGRWPSPLSITTVVLSSVKKVRNLNNKIGERHQKPRLALLE